MLLSPLATGKCTITIDVTAPEDASSWYDLWQTAVALNGMCARSGKVGKARLMGEYFFQWNELISTPCSLENQENGVDLNSSGLTSTL